MRPFLNFVLARAAENNGLPSHFSSRLRRRALVALLLAASAIGSVAVESKLERREVREEGLVGTLLLPADRTPTTGVIVLGGSEGGLRSAEWIASHFARAGWPTLALAYFGVDTLPPHLAGIPLEYFDRGVSWMAAQSFVEDGSVALVGSSRGAEIALLVAAHNPNVSRVVAFAPSSVQWGPLAPPSASALSAWTRRNLPLPFVPLRPTAVAPGQPYHGVRDFLAALKNERAVAAATIPVERINGAVLLLSGGDDQLWPSNAMAEAVMARLRAHAHPYPFAHVNFPAAGHVLLPGADPRLTLVRHPTGPVLALGGTPEANQEAQREGWSRVLEFLGQKTRGDRAAPPASLKRNNSPTAAEAESGSPSSGIPDAQSAPRG